ncbi:solute carrier organic anion transporter [Pyxidicoccus caerfyrddinensis]|uniref:solute carrier organic anion transporter n=1 Tax=Pyxidicoccus caerfyrddinensis TaxID=2709663 RepID=UPI0013DC0F27|nr:solute carrier organic anion transporter [Pyxidicoccus caerfyrddinensis]
MRTPFRAVLVLLATAWLTACGPQLPEEVPGTPEATAQSRAAMEMCPQVPLSEDGASLYQDPYCEPGYYCGDGSCQYFEDWTSCPYDCPAPSYCGDGWCNTAVGERETSCAADCYCGDGICNSDESVSLCPKDCGCPNLCGNGVCNNNEGTATCPGDCGTLCGDGVCNGGESQGSCPSDCHTCGDGICTYPETRVNCRADCYVSPCIYQQCPIEP